jgi:hypothetical protein
VCALERILSNRTAVLIFRLVCAMAIGVRAYCINYALPVEFKFVRCGLGIDWEIVQELRGLRGNFTAGPKKSKA